VRTHFPPEGTKRAMAQIAACVSRFQATNIRPCGPHAAKAAGRHQQRLLPVRRTAAVREEQQGGAEAGARGESATETLEQWMVANYFPWVKTEEDAGKCLAMLRDKEGRDFNLDKAKTVLESVQADHKKWQRDIPFSLPKRWPGMLLILERSSDRR